MGQKLRNTEDPQKSWCTCVCVFISQLLLHNKPYQSAVLSNSEHLFSLSICRSAIWLCSSGWFCLFGAGSANLCCDSPICLSLVAGPAGSLLAEMWSCNLQWTSLGSFTFWCFYVLRKLVSSNALGPFKPLRLGSYLLVSS